MAVRITGIQPKTSGITDPVLAHLAIENFRWVNEQTQDSGVSDRASMFDWIVNKKGKAYVKKGEEVIFVYGVAGPTSGQQFIRSVEGGKWTDVLLELPPF